jgi:polysaccharide biosynthesis protein VpsM
MCTNLFEIMPVRTALLIICGILGTLSTALGSPAIVLGEDSALSFRLGGAIQYNDNIFLDSTDTESDTIFVFSPGVELNIGKPDGNANINVVFVENIITYSDNSRLNRETPDVKLQGFQKTAKSKVDYGISYAENAQNDASNNLTGDLARRNILKANIDGEWSVTAKSSIKAGYSLEDITYDSEQFYDREHSNLPVNYYWGVTPKLDMSVGYRHRTTSFDPRNGYLPDPFSKPSDFDDDFFNVGVRGQIGAKTSGEIRVGVQNRDFNTAGKNDEDLFSVDAKVTWQATEKSNLSLLASRDFNADAFGTSIESTDVQLAGTTALSENFNGFASIRLSKDDYNGGRSDDGLFGQVGVSYAPNSYSAISVAYVIYNNDSSYMPADFDNNVINISGTLRY